MYVTNNTDDYHKIADSNFTNKCRNSEDNIDVFIPTLLLATPCGLSFFCSLSLMVYTLSKSLFNNK